MLYEECRSIRTVAAVPILALALAAAGCSSIDTFGLQPAGAATLETGHSVWLTPREREYVYCADGQLMVCGNGLGRLGKSLCACPPEWTTL